MQYYLSVLTIGGINVILILGLTLLTSYTGLFSMGNVGFMMIGAYVSAILNVEFGVPFLPSLLLAGLVSMLLGLFIGWPTVRRRLKGDHFAVAMLGFASAIKVLISNIEIGDFDGAMGIKNVPKLTKWYVVLIVGAIIAWLIWNFVHSAYGRNCRAVREQEVAAQTMGINVSRTKLISVLINAFTTAIGGGLFAFYTTIVVPTMFTQNQSSNHLIAVVFGGINSVTGPVLASFVLAILPEMLRVISTWRLVIYGVLIVVIMLVKPEGLLGYKEINFRWVKPAAVKFKHFCTKLWAKLSKSGKRKQDGGDA